MHSAFTVYWFGFVIAFLATAVWETYRPKRELSTPTGHRWGMHSLLWIVSVVVSVIVFRASPLMLALNPPIKSWGLSLPSIPWAIRMAATIVLFDLTTYTVHRLFHALPLLWRVHQVHHSDPDYDVSTAARFHPIEVLVSQVALMGAVLLFGMPAAGVLAAELLANGFSFFDHANASLPPWLDSRLRRVMVTPDMHRVHHSDQIVDQSSNFGEVFSWWDRVFGTYSREPAGGTATLKTGLPGFQHPGSLRLRFMMTVPFFRTADSALAKDRTRA